MRTYMPVLYQTGIEVLAKYLLGDIILSRPQTAGSQYDIDALEGVVYGSDNMLPIVMNGSNLVQLYAVFVQPLRHPSRIGIYHLPDEQLVAYGNYFCAHCFFHSSAVRHNSSYHPSPNRRTSGSLRN